MEENTSKSNSNEKRKKKKKRVITSNSEEDRLSCLPESILHHILSFLDMKEVVQTSFISTNWRYVWKSVPVLNFDYSMWNEKSKKNKNSRPYVKKVYLKDDCMAFVDRILRFRDNSSSNIRKINLSRYYCYDSRRLHTWLISALHVVELHIVFPCARNVFSVELPDSIVSARSLRSLYLEYGRLPKGGSNRELNLCFSALEILILKYCDHNHLRVLHISALKLKNLEIQSDILTTPPSCSIKICTPNLTSLHFHPCSLMNYSPENLSSLVSAKIGERSGILDIGCLIKLLKGLQNVTTLELLGSYERMPEFKHMMDQLLSPFSNLRCLKLIGLHDDSCIQAIVNFLKSAPSIETLAFEVLGPMSMKDNEDDWGAELSSQFMFYRLRCVKVRYLKCSKNELKILAFLLRNSMDLESLTLTFTESTLSYRKKEMEEFSEKLHSLPKASSRARIHFLQTSYQPSDF